MTHPVQGSSILLHGPPKVGKTTLAARFPGPVQFIATEKGHKFLPASIKDNLIRCTTEQGWSTFMGSHKLIKKLKPQTIVIDVIDQLYTQCFDHVCRHNNWDHPQDAGHGKGWAAVRREFLAGMTRLAEIAEELDATIIHISHTTTEELKLATRDLTRLTTTMPGQCKSVITPAVDHIWFLGYARVDRDAIAAPTQERSLWLLGSEHVEAGSRDRNVSRLRDKGLIKPLLEKNPFRQITNYIKEAKKK